MKLLSMKIEGQSRAGLIVGEEVLNVTGLCEILEGRGEWIEADTESATFHHLEGAFVDAISLYRRGLDWLKYILSRIESDPALVEECKKSGVLRPLSEVALNPPVLAPGKILAVGLNYAAHAAKQN